MGATQSHERPSRAEPAPGLLASAPSVDESTALIAARYRLIARLHAGTGGVLYRAEDVAFARPVALRMLTPALSRDESVLERLQARLKTSASMARDDIEASGDILDLTDLGRAENGQVFVVTELLTGENLATLIARDGPLSWQALRPLMVRACQILHLSHQHGLLRLDLQTRHLFPVRDKTQTSTLKILSPGIGDVFGDSLWSSLDPASAARQLRYAAPEQLTGGKVDARTDVYALGIIMYELLCGYVPFADGRPAYVCARHLLEQPPPFPARVLATIPREVVGIVGRALAKAPAERWPTMRAFANAMAAIDFGPCDASGVLEVAAAQQPPPTPSASSPSMRIGPAAGHAPSPAVLPRTLPPLRDAFSSPTPAAPAPAPTTMDSAIDERAQAYERWFKSSQELTAVTGSSSEMAWEEILAAAEEAVAAVASSQGSGTAGDSGVFIPERLLQAGEAATASMVRGRRPVLSTGSPLRGSGARKSATPVIRGGALAAHSSASAPVELAEAAAASTTLQLGPEDLHGIDSPAGDSAADLPVAARPPSNGPSPAESANALREVAAHSAPVWAVSTTEAAAPRRSRPLAWAAAALLTVGAVGGGLRWLRPDPSATPQPVAAALAPPRRPRGRARSRCPCVRARPPRSPSVRWPHPRSGSSRSNASSRHRTRPPSRRRSLCRPLSTCPQGQVPRRPSRPLRTPPRRRRPPRDRSSAAALRAPLPARSLARRPRAASPPRTASPPRARTPNRPRPPAARTRQRRRLTARRPQVRARACPARARPTPTRTTPPRLLRPRTRARPERAQRPERPGPRALARGVCHGPDAGLS